MKLHVWKNTDGLHLSRPPKPSTLEELDFDPDCECRQCGERVLSISADNSNICPWCESSMNRPKMLRYQELDLIRLLKQQSNSNRDSRTAKKRSLIRNGVTEKDLRDYLTANGYYGRSANILKLDLKALERPGWVQVFEFHVHAKQEEGNWEELCGVIRSDERSDLFEVTFYDNSSRNDVVQRATDGMITAQRGPRHWSYWPLMTLVALVFGTAIVGAVLSPEGAPSTNPESVKAEAP